jgi:hypothetical protein
LGVAVRCALVLEVPTTIGIASTAQDERSVVVDETRKARIECAHVRLRQADERRAAAGASGQVWLWVATSRRWDTGTAAGQFEQHEHEHEQQQQRPWRESQSTSAPDIKRQLAL